MGFLFFFLKEKFVNTLGEKLEEIKATYVLDSKGIYGFDALAYNALTIRRDV